MITQLFENKKQKLIWIIYLIVAVKAWDTMLGYNSTNVLCSLKGYNCANVSVTIGVLTLLFAVVSLIVADKKEK